MLLYSLIILDMMNDPTGRCCSVHGITYILVLIGALNWGLVGIGTMTSINLNVVNLLVGQWPMLEQAIYIVV